MIPRLLNYWHSVRSSLWALPVAMICVAIGAAVVAVNIRLSPGPDPVWFLYSGGAKNASLFLSHLVTAMITMATLAISITMVVLTLAAQQLGPRLIRSFMRDRVTQLAIGLFVSTVIYLLIVLRNTYGDDDNTPNLAVTIGTALVFSSVVFLLLFVHHLARSIIADNVVHNVGRDLDGQIRRLLPEKDSDPAPPVPESICERGMPVLVPTGGYIQTVDFERLLRIATSGDLIIELQVRAGHHIIAHSPAGWVAPKASATEEVLHDIAACILRGSERNPVQDLEFSIRQMVEIAVRALSPGINDPYTAMVVVDRLSLSVGLVMQRGPAKSSWQDDDGTVRVIARVSTFDGIVDAAYNQIRQRSAQSPDVLMRLAENLSQLIELADRQQRTALVKHLRLVLDVGRRSIEDKLDLQALEDRAAPVLAEPGKAATGRPRGSD